ncbi:hypothetical protein CWI38_0174p0020 [Hamiltosporidium tvaerminnensis]|uniref:Uncharacterized protein n=1 Tax=Hamiltosporidium tvaerminnensis TaxID=1176355 RepID=A0A4V2JY62_9MICR|nr:hypothetical protein CWI38_0174p0020 [Hamiltosporidium tvaerminnensis]
MVDQYILIISYFVRTAIYDKYISKNENFKMVLARNMHNIYHPIPRATFQRSLKNEADLTNENDSNINYQINSPEGENLDKKIKNIENKWNLEYIKGLPPSLRKGKQIK